MEERRMDKATASEETVNRIDELQSYLDAKIKLLEGLRDEIKVEWERQKSLIRRQITLEDEIKDIEDKLKKLREDKIGEDLSEKSKRI